MPFYAVDVKGMNHRIVYSRLAGEEHVVCVTTCTPSDLEAERRWAQKIVQLLNTADIDVEGDPPRPKEKNDES